MALPPLNKQATVLIVEDNQESIDLLVYFLEPAGYKVITASDGYQAIEMVENHAPDIILLDIMLPGLDGYEVCERLKKNERTFHIPIIMITALKELKDKIRALEAGADDFISKPFDSVELLARVKSLLRLKFYHDELIRKNQELEKKQRQLMREDQLKKELTNLIVHDMKNPLFIIQGNLQMMHMQKGNADFDEKYTKRIERSSRSLLRMVLNLLDISRLEQKTMELEPVPVDVNALIQQIIAYFQDVPEHENKIVQLKLGKELPPAYVDKDIFERVLDNLFHFVFKNTPEYMTVLVETAPRDERLEIKVSHDGRPIPDKFKEKIFQKYAQTELKQEGFKPARGLGLIFCKMAMKAHGGDIYLARDIHEGNSFVLEVPAYVRKKSNAEKQE